MARLYPVDLEFLLHCHYGSGIHPRATAPSYVRAAQRLLAANLITYSDEKGGAGFTTTERGIAWLEIILSTPFPKTSSQVVQK